MNDLKFAIRQLLKNPGFTAVVVLTLALGIGANTAVFSVINGVVLRPLGYAEPDRLVALWEHSPDDAVPHRPVSFPTFSDWKQQNRVFESVGFWTNALYWMDDPAINIVGPDGVEKARGAQVESDVFTALKAQPLLGRTFRPEEDQRGADATAVLGYDLWQRRFGGSPDVLGKTLTFDSFDRRNYTIVGVMPPGFAFPDRCELWLSAAENGALSDRRDSRWLNVLARLKPGITIEQAKAELDTIQGRIRADFPAARIGSRVAVVPLLEQTLGRNLKVALLVLWGVVAGVMLIACVNVANLLLTRAADRGKEISVRLALGASRWRVVRQLLIESVLLALLGGAVGVLVGEWGLKLMVAASPAYVPRLGEVKLDWAALLFTLAISLGTGILFGLAPAWRFTRPELNDSLKEGCRGASGGLHSARVRSSLVMAEVALSLVLLVGAGLMLQSFVRLVRTDRGFRPDHLLTAELDFSVTGFTTWMEATDTRPQVTLQQLLERLRNTPGVMSVGAASRLPRRAGPPNERIIIIGREPDAVGDGPIADHSGVSPDFFLAMGTPLLRGRSFTEADQLDAQPVVVINQTFAKRHFPNEDPLGRMIAFPSRTNRWVPGEFYQNRYPVIVGVVADVATLTPNPEAHPHFYSPYWQYPMQSPTVVARVRGDPAALVAAVRSEVKALAPGLPAPAVQTMDHVLAQTVALPRFQASVLGAFASLALVLAAVGLYGVLAYSVAQRRREIGVRVALGARRRDILSLVVGQGMKLASAGVVIGIFGALALTRVLRNLLYQIDPTDPATYVAVALLLGGTALLACWLPARHAARVDPMEALRHE